MLVLAREFVGGAAGEKRVSVPARVASSTAATLRVQDEELILGSVIEPHIAFLRLL